MAYERAPVAECKSRIDGRLIRVRHAVEGDFLLITKRLKEFGALRDARDYGEYIVAEMEGDLLGFGSVSEEGEGMSRFSIHVAARHGYLAELMAKHLAEHPPK